MGAFDYIRIARYFFLGLFVILIGYTFMFKEELITGVNNSTLQTVFRIIGVMIMSVGVIIIIDGYRKNKRSAQKSTLSS